MNDRREPTISTLSPDSEPTETARAREASPTANRPRRTPPPVSSRPVIVRSPLGPIALLVAILAAGAAGYLYWLNLQQQQAAADQTQKFAQNMQAAEQRIAELEQRLSLAGDESSQSMTVIQAKVKENASEIRKLWGVAYDTNRKAIAELNDQFTALNKSLGGLDKSTQQALKDIAGELQVLGDLTQAQQAVVSRADQFMDKQTQSLDKMLDRVQTLEKSVNKRLSANEEAIRAIDAFRVQVNRELINLKGG